MELAGHGGRRLRLLAGQWLQDKNDDVVKGKRPGAHGDHIEQASRLGEGPERAEQQGGSPAAGDGNEDGGINAELPGSPGSLRT